MMGTHKHLCHVCGTVWEHDDACQGNTAAHRCPKPGCFTLTFVPYEDAHEGRAWLPARKPMINRLMPTEAAFRIVASEACAGYLVSVCSQCQDPELRAVITAHGLPNVSHGLCPGCLAIALEQVEEFFGKGALA